MANTPAAPTFTQNNWPVYGHNWAVDYLRKGILNDRVRQAYLFVGTPSIGKTTFAHAFAMALNCQHEDLAERPCGECRSCRLTMSGNHSDIVYPDTGGGAVKIEALRGVMQKIALKPFEARYRIAIVPDFDTALHRTQDVILKTLEEPPRHAVIMLLASSTENLMSTITSRCQTVHLRPVSTSVLRDVLVERYAAEPEQAALLARLSGGRIGWAIDALQQPDTLEQRGQALDLLEQVIRMNRRERFDLAQDLSKDKAALGPLLSLWQTYWRDVLLMLENSPVNPCNSDRMTAMQQLAYKVSPDEALAALKATRELIGQLTLNVNLRLAIEVMFLYYPGLPDGR